MDLMDFLGVPPTFSFVLSPCIIECLLVYIRERRREGIRWKKVGVCCQGIILLGGHVVFVGKMGKCDDPASRLMSYRSISPISASLRFVIRVLCDRVY